MKKLSSKLGKSNKKLAVNESTGVPHGVKSVEAYALTKIALLEYDYVTNGFASLGEFVDSLKSGIESAYRNDVDLAYKEVQRGAVDPRAKVVDGEDRWSVEGVTGTISAIPLTNHWPGRFDFLYPDNPVLLYW